MQDYIYVQWKIANFQIDKYLFLAFHFVIVAAFLCKYVQKHTITSHQTNKNLHMNEVEHLH